jgi:hypothetical protein
MENVIIETSTATLVDRSRMAKLSGEDLAAAMAQAYQGPKAKPVVFIDDAKTFFSLKNLEKAIETNTSDLPVLLAYHEIVLVPEDFAAIERARNVQAYIRTAVEAKREASRPVYPFADVPTDWTLESKLEIGRRTIKRTNGEYYSIGLSASQRLWEQVAPYWAGGGAGILQAFTLRASGYYNNVTPHRNYLQVGCQRVERYELEQLALNQGWEFPKAPSPL